MGQYLSSEASLVKKYYRISLITAFFILMAVVIISKFLLPGDSTGQIVLITGLIVALLIAAPASLIMVAAVFQRFGIKVFTRRLWENSRRYGPYMMTVSLITIGLVGLLLDYPRLAIIVSMTFLSLALSIIPSIVRLRYPHECHCRSVVRDWFYLVFGFLTIFAAFIYSFIFH